MSKVLKPNPTTIEALRNQGVPATITNDINCPMEVERIDQEDALNDLDKSRLSSESEIDLLDIANANEQEIEKFCGNYLDVLDRIEREEKNVYKVANAMKQKKNMQKLIAGGNYKKANHRQRLEMVERNNKIRKNARGFGRIMFIKGRNMRTQAEFDSAYYYLEHQIRSHYNSEPFKVQCKSEYGCKNMNYLLGRINLELEVEDKIT